MKKSLSRLPSIRAYNSRGVLGADAIVGAGAGGPGRGTSGFEPASDPPDAAATFARRPLPIKMAVASPPPRERLGCSAVVVAP